MKTKTKRGNTAVIAIIVVIVAITFAVIGYLFAKKTQAPAVQPVAMQPATTQTAPAAPVAQTQPVTTQPVATDATAGWQTYANAKYAYTVEYPGGWFSYADNTSDVFLQSDKEVAGNVPGAHANAFEIKVSPTNETVDAVVSDLGKQAGIQYAKTNIKIGNEDGLKIVSNCEGAGCGVPEWVVVNNGNLYHFVSNLGYSSQFDQILSTFKFTN